MRGVTILDQDPVSHALTFDLRDILELLGSDGRRSMWVVRDVECVGGSAAQELHQVSDSGLSIPGQVLTRLAQEVGQIFEGEFLACLPGDREVWIAVRAIDGSAFDVETDRVDVIEALKGRFRRVESLPD
jgi:hypothetical protein